MTDTVTSFASTLDLADYVRDTLCRFDALDPAQITFIKTPLNRGGQPWGIVFHAEGPRLLRTSAIWAAEAGTIVFYDSTGLKRHEVKLVDSPEIEVQVLKQGRKAA